MQADKIVMKKQKNRDQRPPIHAVMLDSDKCKGCINCIKRCPTQAIRVRNGKASIIDERCIDCGECIRVCQNHAKLPIFDPLVAINRFKYKVALPAPALYGQFNNLDNIDIVLNALLAFGFDDVFEVAKAAEIVSDRTRTIMEEDRQLPRPLISSACPAVVRLIRVRFPELVGHLLPLNAPIELAARMALERARAARPDLARDDIGIVFISPCAAKVTAVRNPLTTDASEVDAVFAIKDIYPKLLPLMSACAAAAAMANGTADGSKAPGAAPAGTGAKGAEAKDGAKAESGGMGVGVGAASGVATHADGASGLQSGSAADSPAACKFAELSGAGRMGISWCGSGGESSALLSENYLAADGIENVIQVLEGLEDERLAELDFIELNACAAGCVGGILNVENPFIANTRIKKLRRFMPVSLNHFIESDREKIEWSRKLEYSPVLKLPGDYEETLEKMARLNKLLEGLPGLDCGSCGAPTCESLAEDVVRGVASETDCIFRLRDYVRGLVSDMNRLENYIPPPFRK